jgi:hypothetical protein
MLPAKTDRKNMTEDFGAREPRDQEQCELLTHQTVESWRDWGRLSIVTVLTSPGARAAEASYGAEMSSGTGS